MTYNIRKQMTLLSAKCYSQELSACSNHPIFQPQKFIDLTFNLLRKEVDKLTVIGDNEIRASCLGEGMYYTGELSWAASENVPVLMPQFRKVAQAQLNHNTSQLNEALGG